LDDATTLRETIKPHPTPRPCCTTPSKLVVLDEVDANRYASETLQLAAAPKMMPHEGE
jgi:hypothetical protein